MSKTVLARQCFFSRPRRQFSTSSVKRTSTSPQRYNMSEPAVRSGNVKKFSDIPGPLALPIMRHHAHVLPRIGCFHHTVGLGLLEGLQQRYGDLVRFAKATRSRPVLYVFDPELMKEVYDSNMTVSPQWSQSPLNEHRKNADTKCPMQSDESKAVWTALRTLLQDDSFLRNFDKAFDDIAVDVTRRLEGLRHAGNALNEELQTEIYRWAIEIIGVLIFGMRLGCLDGNVHVPTEENRNPEKTSMDDHIKDLCSLTKKSERDLSPAERFVRCSLDVANENYLVRSEDTLRQESETFNEALKTFDKHYSLTDHFLVRALENLNNEELKAEQVLLNKLRPLERRILPLAADAFLAGVDPVIGADGDQHAVRAVAAATGGVVRRSVGELSVAGYEVPEGVDIVLAHGVSSKLEKEWGRAKSFIPERWHSDGWRPLNASRAHRCASMPFGQTCPAAGVVNKMLSSLAIRVLDTYRIEWHGTAPRVTAAGVNKIQRPYYFVLQNAG
ncbi:cytochrome P450 333B11 [Danaus plexippus plexippus]|uniref:Cytochrome P450 333B11 n=1 Tax=Danaus plexippus plexippus TaxID=278856 RepID=A0A212F014_DANPL|nr:cytochrome P450 333B11 [Danaus plexippus plexippus]